MQMRLRLKMGIVALQMGACWRGPARLAELGRKGKNKTETNEPDAEKLRFGDVLVIVHNDTVKISSVYYD
jgi:hypothetical protein